MRVIRVDRGNNHWYVDLDAGKVRVPGVTGLVKGGMPAPALMNWSATATAGYTLDNWDMLAALPASERLGLMNKGRYGTRDAAANKGRDVHTMAERLIAGERVTIPDALTGYVQAAARFLDEFDFREEHVECLVYNETHYYSGQLDIIGTVMLPDMPEYDHIPRDDEGRSRGLFDWKTSKSGIFGEVALQLVAYRYAEFIQPDPKDPGTAIDMPEVDFTAGIHIRRDGYTVVPLVTDADVFRDFLYVKEVARIADKDAMKALVGDPILPPLMSSYRLAKADDDAPRYDLSDGIAPNAREQLKAAELVATAAYEQHDMGEFDEGKL